MSAMSAMSERDFEGRVALVTGGSRGIGRAVCVRLARAGAAIALNYITNHEAARETQALIAAEGARCALFPADVANPEAVETMVRAAEQALGPVDLLVANAGIFEILPHEAMTFAHWRRIMAVNLDGTYLPVMAVKDGMIQRGDGRIVCLSSIAALRARDQAIAYAAAKGAVIAFARSCAEAFAPQIRINCVAPGLIDTEMGRAVGDKLVQTLIEATPLQRIGRPGEIAELVCFLLSDRASYTTGQTIVASGGRVTLP